ncbi:hypothetical protein ACFOOK_21630 [Micromonospora krabiensis]|uniref:Uncharacterized protein n=1 Tax=Micromonospora krabiensis TaxID=307121 RepID=A0A1C3N8C6_9ACTN|nr:hypothetical protein [Micromonospora krabiensis]SBV28828.1 hypothetical protein GA0070620_4385 [Micromonospora krabiensis]
MESQFAVLVPIAAVWLAAGVLADGLPGLDRACALRRRSGWLLVLTLTGLTLTAAVLGAGLLSPGGATADRAAAALDLAALPALVVAACGVRRVHRLWSGAGAFATAPDTPASHGLRAAAAHPLIGLPLQVTGLLTVPAVITASGSDLFARPGVTGPAITVGAVAVLAVGIRHALRHNRFAERIRRPAATERRRTPVTGQPEPAVHRSTPIVSRPAPTVGRSEPASARPARALHV